jgi:hypothetical protein
MWVYTYASRYSEHMYLPQVFSEKMSNYENILVHELSRKQHQILRTANLWVYTYTTCYSERTYIYIYAAAWGLNTQRKIRVVPRPMYTYPYTPIPHQNFQVPTRYNANYAGTCSRVCLYHSNFSHQKNF